MILAVITFIATYALLIDGYYRRTLVVLFAAFFLLLTGVLTPLTALRAIDWNVMAIFIGMLILADLFLHSRMPAVLAAKLAARTKTVGMAVLGMCVLASILSMFLENVAVVLVLAPIALALAKQLETRAAPFLIGIALSSNLQGTATLVGDPPSMILGAFANLTFNDFFWYHGRPGIFFAVQVGAIASFAMLWWLFRKFQ
ncbi:MAG: SLC13 family permease, partial [bacterium]|nr:SLC13 family permease [bacterium]